MLLKYDHVSRKKNEQNALMYKDKAKTMLRWIILAMFLFFPLLFYVPLYFQVSLSKKSGDEVVQGWGFNTSRSVSHYIFPHNDSALIVDSQLCSEPLLLLIVVCSAVKNSLERATIRETWGNFSSSSYKLAFLLGTTENVTLQENVEEESSFFGDIIQENFIDSYNNLTLKSVMLLKYIRNHCDKVEYILKSDDDMFIHVQNLVSLVKTLSEKKFHKVLLGYLICFAKPILNSRNKWYSPRYMYEGTFYPHYLSGTSYLMDRETAVLLYEAALTTPLLHLEDVYITGLCAKKAKIRPRDHTGFSLDARPLDPCIYIKNTHIITSHRVTLENMKQLWSGLYNRSSCSDHSPTITNSNSKPTNARLGIVQRASSRVRGSLRKIYLKLTKQCHREDYFYVNFSK